MVPVSLHARGVLGFAMYLTVPFVVPPIYRHAHRNRTGASFSCREYHLCVAVSSKNTKLHCPLSSLAGGGVCVKCTTSVLFLSLALWRSLLVSRLRTNLPPQPHSPSPRTAGYTIPYHAMPCHTIPCRTMPCVKGRCLIIQSVMFKCVCFFFFF